MEEDKIKELVKEQLFDKKNDAFWCALFGMGTSILLFILIFGGCLITPLLEYKVKMKMVEVANKAVDKGLELRLDGNLLKGIELVKITNQK